LHQAKVKPQAALCTCSHRTSNISMRVLEGAGS